MATIVTRYLDGASAGGDGTTNALSGANAAYNSFSSWQTAELKDLVTANEIHKLICSGAGVTETFALTGWTTDIDHFVWVTVEAGSRHTGIPGTGFKITSAATWNHTFSANQDYAVIEWMEAAGTLPHARGFGHGKNAILIGCIGSSANAEDGFEAFNGGSYCISCMAFNCAVYGFSSGNFDAATYYNCTSVGNGTDGFYYFGTFNLPNAINCVGFGNTADFVSGDGWLTATDYNASEDLTAPGTTKATGIVAGDFTDTAGNDYSVSGTTSALYAAGRSIEPELAALDRTQYTLPRLDLAGNPLTTDIGAFAYLAAGATLSPDNGTHSHLAGNVTLSQGVSLTVQNASHGVSSDTVTIDQAQSLLVASASHSLTSDTVTLAQGQMIVSTGATHSLTSTSPALSQGQTLSVQNSVDALSSDNVTLAQIQAIVVLNATHGLTSGNVTFNPAAVIPSADRTYMADASNRTATASATGRTYTVPARN